MLASKAGTPAETLQFQRFQTNLPPPYGPENYRFSFGVKVYVDGRQLGHLSYSTLEPTEKNWSDMEDDIRKNVEHYRANVII